MNASFLAKVGMLRWLAALVAVAYHVRFLLLTDYAHVQHKGPLLSLFYFVTSLGHESFIVFMVLSGLLLGGLSARRWQGRTTAPWDDVWRKLGALYLLLVPALAVGGLLDFVGSTALGAPGVYAIAPQFAPGNLGPGTLAGNLFLLQDILVPGFGSNAMLCLLAWEWWAYLVLAIWFAGQTAHAAHAPKAALLVAALLVFLQPGLLGYLAAWLAGLAVACMGQRLQGRLRPWLGTVIFLAALLVSRLGGYRLGALAPLPATAGRIVLDLAVALGLAAMLLSLYGRQSRRYRPLRARWAGLQRPLVRLGPPLYASQFPAMIFVVAAARSLFDVRLQAQPSAEGFVLFGAVVAAIYAFALLLARAVGAARALLSRGARGLALRFGA